MIYLVEDEDSIRKLVVYTLENSGFNVRGFENAENFWNAVHEMRPELILLDIMLPGQDGLSILQKLRSSSVTAKIPVMMLTAKSTEFDKVTGLDLGADDYLAKPFGMMELVARVRSLIRRTSDNPSVDVYTISELTVDIPRHKVVVSGNTIALTFKEFELLTYLLRNRGLVLSRDQILNSVWGYEFNGETRTVDVHIRTLRNKLETAGQLIKTVRGIGYCIGDEV